MDPISAATDVLGDRWTLLILRDVVFHDRRHFRALLNGSEEGIATNILADRLARLLEAGILTRGTALRGQRAFYSLTAAGIDAVPILWALEMWGRRHRHADTTADVLPGGSLDEFLRELRNRHLGAGDGNGVGDDP